MTDANRLHPAYNPEVSFKNMLQLCTSRLAYSLAAYLQRSVSEDPMRDISGLRPLKFSRVIIMVFQSTAVLVHAQMVQL